VIYGERHLRRILSLYSLSITMKCARTWGWAKIPRYDGTSSNLGPSSPHQFLFGLHHRYARIRFSGGTTILALPSAPCVAPITGLSPQMLENFRARIMRLTYISGLSKLPQITYSRPNDAWLSRGSLIHRMGNEFLPISMPITEIAELSLRGIACSSSLAPLASFPCWRGRSTAGPSHYRT
jgi:hypothetical protein